MERAQPLRVALTKRRPSGRIFPCPSARPHRLEAKDIALSRRKPGFESRWGHYPARLSAGWFYTRKRTANPAPTVAPTSAWGRVCALRITRDQTTSGSARRKMKPRGPRSRSPAAAACPATVQWALAFQSSVIPATAALARPIERVSKERFCGASSNTRAASRATKAASRNIAGVRRSARVEIQKSPTRERRRSSQLHRQEEDAPVDTGFREGNHGKEHREDDERVECVRKGAGEFLRTNG